MELGSEVRRVCVSVLDVLDLNDTFIGALLPVVRSALQVCLAAAHQSDTSIMLLHAALLCRELVDVCDSQDSAFDV